MEAPERIMAWTHKYNGYKMWAVDILADVAKAISAIEYIRADLAAQKDAEIDALNTTVAELMKQKAELEAENARLREFVEKDEWVRAALTEGE